LAHPVSEVELIAGSLNLESAVTTNRRSSLRFHSNGMMTGRFGFATYASARARVREGWTSLFAPRRIRPSMARLQKTVVKALDAGGD
jgi:hypothetical protein